MNCQVDDCEKPGIAKEYCWMHYRRVRKHGDPNYVFVHPHKGKNTDNLTGWVHRGYRQIRVNGQMIFEHRHVMQQALGRKLSRNEYVHHRNGQRLDNRIENLELWVTAQPPGQRPSDLVKFAEEILNKYQKDVDSGLLS